MSIEIINSKNKKLTTKSLFCSVSSIVLSILSYSVLVILEITTFSLSLIAIFYGVAHLFLLWTIFEVLLKQDYYYLITLLLVGVPLQNWLVHTSNAWGINLGLFVINYTLIMVVVLMVRLFHIKRGIIKVKLDTVVLFALVLSISTISILFTENIYITMNSIVYGMIIPFLIYFIIYNIVSTKEDMVVIFDIIVKVLMFFNVISIALEMTILPNATRFRGIFENANYYAPLLLISTFLSLFLLFYFKEKKDKLKFIYVASFIISFVLLLIIGSRTALLLFLIGLIIFYIQLPNKPTKLIVSFAFLIIATSSFMFLDINSIIENTSLLSLKRLFFALQSENSDARIQIWKNSVEYIREKRLIIRGIGFGRYLNNEIGYNTAHNSFLTLSMTVGVFGSLIYHYILIRGINTLNLLLRKDLEINISGLIVLLLLIQWNITGNGFTLYSRYEIQPNMGVYLDVILLWVLVGLSQVSKRFR